MQTHREEHYVTNGGDAGKEPAEAWKADSPEPLVRTDPAPASDFQSPGSENGFLSFKLL